MLRFRLKSHVPQAAVLAGPAASRALPFRWLVGVVSGAKLLCARFLSVAPELLVRICSVAHICPA